jgi:hypothetical protein
MHWDDNGKYVLTWKYRGKQNTMLWHGKPYQITDKPLPIWDSTGHFNKFLITQLAPAKFSAGMVSAFSSRANDHFNRLIIKPVGSYNSLAEAQLGATDRANDFDGGVCEHNYSNEPEWKPDVAGVLEWEKIEKGNELIYKCEGYTIQQLDCKQWGLRFRDVPVAVYTRKTTAMRGAERHLSQMIIDFRNGMSEAWDKIQAEKIAAEEAEEIARANDKEAARKFFTNNDPQAASEEVKVARP